MRRGAMLALAFAWCAACQEPATVTCPDGNLCPAGTVCGPGVLECYPPAQADACRGLAPGADCHYASTGVETCVDGICIKPGCGNGIVEGAEGCDDGNHVNGDGCSDRCGVEVCGNGIVDPGEGCDCGTDPGKLPEGCDRINDDAAGICTTTCELHCGDGVVAPPEDCEPGIAITAQCADVGLDYGYLGCSQRCGFDTSSCQHIGLQPDPLPSPNDLIDVVSFYRDLFAITAGGVLRHRLDGVWDSVPGGHSVPLRAIGGADPDHVYVVGAAGYLGRWDAASHDFAAVTVPTSADLDAIFAAAVDDVWVVGSGGTVLHDDGTGWSIFAFPDPSANLIAVYESHGVLFLADDAGNLYQEAGGVYTTLPGTAAFRAIAGSDDHNVWAVGDFGYAERWDGTQWNTESPYPSVNFHDVWVDADEAFLVGDDGSVVHHDAQGWSKLQRVSTATLRGISGPTASQLEVVGDQGTVLDYPGMSWLETSSNTGEPLHALWYVPGQGAVVAGYEGTVLEEDGSAFDVLPVVRRPPPEIFPLPLSAVYAPDYHDVYVAGSETTVMHGDGASPWTAMDAPASDWTTLWGSGGDGDIFLFGSTTEHFAGATWDPEPSGQDFQVVSVAASTAQDLIGVGNSNHVLWRRHGAWSLDTLPSAHPFRGVWLADDGTAVAVGDAGEIASYDGTAWSRTTVGFEDLDAIDGTSPDDLWACGRGGALLMRSRDGWTKVHTPTFFDLFAIWVTPSIVYVVGDAGTILRLLRSTG